MTQIQSYNPKAKTRQWQRAPGAIVMAQTLVGVTLVAVSLWGVCASNFRDLDRKSGKVRIVKTVNKV